MTMLLKSKHGLLVFRVAFVAVPGEPMLNFTVERFVRGFPEYEKSWEIPLSETNIPDLLQNGPAPTLRLPHAITSALPRCLREAAASEREPLWLHLVKPYGYIGALPWEAAIREISARPIFRLPDFLETPRENSSVLDVALLWDVSVGAEMSAMLREAIGLWLQNPNRSLVRVHLFCTDPIALASLEGWNPPGLTVHPAALMIEGGDTNQSESRLLGWIRDCVAPAALDAVHVVARATFDLDRSHLQLSAEKGSGNQPVFFLAPSEICSFLNQVGAWSFILSGPPDRSAAVALRHFADSIAQARPGPAIYHPLSHESLQNELGPVIRLLFSSGTDERPIVRQSFVYCQPGLVCEAIQLADQPTMLGLGPHEELLETAWSDAETEQAPDWVASVQRVVEEYGLECTREASGDVLLRDLLSQAPQVAKDLEESRATSVLQRTLDDVQWLVRRFRDG